ncbi:b(0,+)-type amino acid transporter 1-like [Denticeps clupeoides]|uniref:b(0,+)-type amino acid transporter 1-like n=1 Tax=Denticeps clupeoides TaxID=299321 RepID=UPI0010A2FAF9|nr:b(0,+)-type amino acid transporter 1-like [Denticeps clupeoides]
MTAEVLDARLNMQGIGTKKLKLKKELGLVNAVCLTGGVIIGSGIFMSPQYVLAYSGSPGASLVIWSVCGIVSMLGALAFAELGTIIKESGGEYIYIFRIFGSFPAYFVAFSFLFVTRPMSIVAKALSFSEYAMAPFYEGCPPPKLGVKTLAVASILTLATANTLNVRLTMRIQVLFTVAKLVGLLIIAIGGLVGLAQGNFGHLENIETSFENTQLAVKPIGMALYQGFWSYSGWATLNYVTEEVKKPEKKNSI